jgi:hypothetical protein
MIAIRLSAFLLVAALAVARQTALPSKSAKPSVPEPKLPVIDSKACPGEGRTVPHVKIERDDRIYSSWEDKRVLVAPLKAGDEVTVLAGVNVIRQPGRALATQPDVDHSLKPGDVVLVYGFHGGDYDVWAKGAWFTESYEALGDMQECGFRDHTMCTWEIVKRGVNEWWVQVKTGAGSTGWVLAEKNTGDKEWNDGNFGFCDEQD